MVLEVVLEVVLMVVAVVARCHDDAEDEDRAATEDNGDASYMSTAMVAIAIYEIRFFCS